MVAAPRLRKRENVFTPRLDEGTFPDLLKLAAIYGPNASGKSNLIRALAVLRDLAEREPSARDEPLPMAPFRFDPDLADKPSVFQVHFIHGGVRYQFDVAANSDRIVSERLSRFFNDRESLYYERQHSGSGDKYEFGPQLKDLSAELLDTWRQLTPPKVLFLAQAVANSSEGLSTLEGPLAWLKDSSHFVLTGMEAMARAAQKLAAKGEDHASSIATFLRDVDVPISNIRVETTDLSGGNAIARLAALGVGDNPKRSFTKSKTILTHKTALGEAEIEFEDESDGTKNLIGFWLPWIIKEQSADKHALLIVDELDSSLHPKIVASLVEKHINSNGITQLIFTTHDTHLMDTKLLRRDQFWLTERDINGATKLRSIHDFEGRESEDIEKRYYEGRYRGLPLLRR